VARRSRFFWFWLGATAALEAFAASVVYDSYQHDYGAEWIGAMQLALISPLVALLPAAIFDAVARAVLRRLS
jgi:hypothetical protein